MIEISSAQGSCGTIVCNLLMELKIPFIVSYIDLNAEHNEAQYSLFGQVPRLTHAGFSISQTTAICLYICEHFDKHGYMLSLDSLQRFKQIESLAAMATDIQPMIRMLFKTHMNNNFGYEGLISEAVHYIDNLLQASGGDWLFGHRPTLNDFYAFELMRWVSNTKYGSRLTPIASWLDRCLTLDSVKASIKNENLKVWGRQWPRSCDDKFMPT